MKTVNGCEDLSIMYPQDEREDGQVYSVYCNFLVLLSIQPYAVKT